QAVRGAPSPTRYAGSLLQLDFGETEQTKSVTVVEARPNRPAKVREVALSAGRRLVDVEGTLDEVLDRAESLKDAYLRVFLHTDGPVPGIAERIRDALPNAVDVQLRYERAEPEDEAQPLSSLQPRDQFVSYYRREHGVEAPPDDRAVLPSQQILVEVGEQPYDPLRSLPHSGLHGPHCRARRLDLDQAVGDRAPPSPDVAHPDPGPECQVLRHRGPVGGEIPDG